MQWRADNLLHHRIGSLRGRVGVGTRLAKNADKNHEFILHHSLRFFSFYRQTIEESRWKLFRWLGKDFVLFCSLIDDEISLVSVSILCAQFPQL